MRLNYPDVLPITSHKNEIVKAIEENQVVVVMGETGSGKSTQIPKMIIEALSEMQKTDPVFSSFKIACTQPRRIAAVSLSAWIAHEMGVELGKEVGYKIRFDDESSEGTIITLCTDGILLQEMKGDGLLSKYDAILVDEAHERNLNIDFLLGLLKEIQLKREEAGIPRLKILVTSATFDAKKFADFFYDLNVDDQGKEREVPIINVSGRLYPVNISYDPPRQGEDAFRKIAKLVKGVVRGVDKGDILVFMPGEAEIFRTIEQIELLGYSEIQCLPLYSRLSMDDQELIYKDFPGKIKIVVATNIAETSLTVPGIKYVIDSGVARMTDFNFHTGIGSLEAKPVSQASAIQRAGRAGRVQEGHCIRLFTEEDYESREKYTKPEIQRSDLSSVVLHMLLIGIKNLTGFNFIDAPEGKAFRNAIANLIELGALDEEHSLTPLGVKMAHLPLEPRISAMLLAAEKYDCVREVAIIASSLSVKDPFLRPNGEEAEADSAKRRFQREAFGGSISRRYKTVKIRKGHRIITKRVREREREGENELVSDQIVFLVVWNRLQRIHSDTEREFFCQSNYLNYLMIKEIGQIYRQLLDTLNIFARDEFSKYLLDKDQTDLSVDLTKSEGILKSISSAFIQNLCESTSKQTYRTRTVDNVLIHPGSALFNMHPRFFVSAEIVETTRLFARNNTVIDAKWLEDIAPQQCRVRRGPMFFSKKLGQAIWEEEVFFRNSRIVKGRVVTVASHDRRLAQDYLVREGLVKRNLEDRFAWIRENRKVILDLKGYAAKLDDSDLSFTDQRLKEWYLKKLEKIGRLVVSGKELESVLKEKGDDFLLLREADFISAKQREELEKSFPAKVFLAGEEFEVDYHYDDYRFPGGAVIELTVDQLISLTDEIIKSNLKSFPKLKPFFVVRAGAESGKGKGSVIAEGEIVSVLKQEVDRWQLKKAWKQVRRAEDQKGIRMDEIWHYLPELLKRVEVGVSLFGEGSIYAYTGLKMDGKKIRRTVFEEREVAFMTTLSVLKQYFLYTTRSHFYFTATQIHALEKEYDHLLYGVDLVDSLEKALWKVLDFEGQLKGEKILNNVEAVKSIFVDSKDKLEVFKEKILKKLIQKLTEMGKLSGSERADDLQKLAEMKKSISQGEF